MTIPEDVLRYYERGGESERLLTGGGALELVRTRDVLRRLLPASPSRIADVGGAFGVHARWLAEDGHEVHVVDPVPLHVEHAARLPGVTAGLGDARRLPLADASHDVVLLLGPLYHLLDRADRITAWREAARVVRPGGLVAAATISRFAGLHDGLRRPGLADPGAHDMIERSVRTGEHVPRAGEPWFTEAYFHLPGEPVEEAREAGLAAPAEFAVEGVAWMLPDAEIDAALADPVRRDHLLWTLRETEREPSLLGASSHLLTAATRPRS
ncbi:class I SAM-dependent methyltransferase [Umezawaea beigongshangensis]|uniref:class I SAM-dependent methyltransferase n=1 Tax=Umezawaea beigongshangensis TaxID=2780383 RepID=UPI0018F12D85|nr:class I SAM-dependent methyltransferase [Umezawaea beigongshangensis]